MKTKENPNSPKTVRQPKSRIRELTPKKIVGEAQRIIKLATDILEEEVAAGIVAAKEIEKKIINVEKIRDKDSDHIISRFRSDAHEVIDMLMDVVSVASSKLDNLSNRVINVASLGQENVKKQNASIPIVHCDTKNNPGSESVIKMQLQNDSKENAMEVAFRKIDLINQTGDRILSRNIKIEPEVVKMKPGEKKEVDFIIKTSKSTKSGVYSALIQDKKINSLQAMISLEVI